MSVQHERLIELGDELRLGGMATQYPALAQTAAEKRTSFTDFLEELLVAERESRRARETFARVARFPSIKTLDQDNFGFATGAPRKQIVELASLAFVERAENVVSSVPRVWARLISRSPSATSPPRRAARPASSVRPIWC